jgi:four helix bundle protein
MGDSAERERNPRYLHGQDIRDRAFVFAVRVTALGEDLQTDPGAGRLLARQLIDAANSGNATLAEAQSAESDADFVSKLCIALKEFRETHARLRVLQLRRIGPTNEVADLCSEANQIIAIVVTIIANKRRHAGIDVKSPRNRKQRGR